MSIKLRKMLVYVALAFLGVGACIFLRIMLAPPQNKDMFSLRLWLGRSSISRADFFSGNIPAEIWFTNNSDKAIEFMVNGIDCFQFLEIMIVDNEGKNQATGKYGDCFIVNSRNDKKQIMKPGETCGGTVFIPVIVRDQPLHGTYSVQASLQYGDLNVWSNVVKLTIFQ